MTSTPGLPKERRRRARWFQSLGSWWLDIKLGGRMLIKHPGLALIGGFGIAVAVAIAAGGFSVIYGTFLAPSLPFEESDRIVSIEIWDAAAIRPERRILRDYHVWREELQSVREIGAFQTLTPNLIAAGVQPESVQVAAMSAAGFRVAGTAPLLGRYLTEDDEREGAPWVAVIGESVWRNRFAADPAILGRTIQLGATPHSIVGVMPEGFAFPVNHRFWVPLRLGPKPPEPLMGPDLMAFGRLAPGVTLESAQAELSTIGRRAALESPRIYEQLRPRVLPYTHPFVGLHEANDVSGLHLMQSLFTLLLVLVCLNVAILVYSRTAMRQAEIAIRNALGAGRGRIVAQLFLEALVLSAAAALTGVAIAALVLRWAGTATWYVAAELPFWMSFDLSPGAVLYAGLLSVFAAAIEGVVPALKATGREVQTGLRVIGSGGSGMRLGKTWTLLIVAQVGFAVALLPPAVFSAWRSLGSGIADPGFPAEEFLSARLGMDFAPGTDAAAGGSPEFARRFAERQAELMRRLEAEPGVSGVTFAMANPGEERRALIETQDAAHRPQAAAAQATSPEAVTPEAATPEAATPEAATAQGGRPQAGSEANGPAIRLDSDVREARFSRVDINFFRTFDVPILAGREFEASDIPSSNAGPEATRGSEAVVVNLPLAEQVFGGNALGRRIRYVDGDIRTAAQRNGESGRWYEIVGIVSEFPTGASPEMDGSRLKVYHAAAAGQLQPLTLALHVSGGDPSDFAGRLREIAAAVDPELHLRNILSLDDVLRREQWIRRIEAGALAAVTLSVLLLSAAGIYSLMSITVSQRRKEIGIRMALGANGKRIVVSIFSRAFGQLAAGAAAGAALNAALERASGGSLMQGDGTAVLVVVALLMMAVGILAALGPARRSLRIEPTEALREQ